MNNLIMKNTEIPKLYVVKSATTSIYAIIHIHEILLNLTILFDSKITKAVNKILFHAIYLLSPLKQCHSRVASPRVWENFHTVKIELEKMTKKTWHTRDTIDQGAGSMKLLIYLHEMFFGFGLQKKSNRPRPCKFRAFWV